jgi:long-chain acyl-CoA synthetase
MTTGTAPVYMEKGDTWPKVLRYNYEKYGDNHKAMRHKYYGIWQPYTWKDYYLNVKYLSLGLLSIGFEPDDKMLIIGDNAPQWYYAELAAQSNYGVSIGAYSDLTPHEIRYIAENCEARFAIVEDQEQIDKLIQIKDELPLLEKIIYWNYKGLAHYSDPLLMGFREILHVGEEYEREHPGVFEQNVDAGKPDDVCAIVYTSGATGDAPKGAVHTYQTMRAGAEYHLRLDPWHEDDNIVPYLPPVWINEQLLGIGCHLLSGSILNFCEASETQQRDTKEIRPDIVSYSARLWQNQAAGIQARIDEAGPIKRLAFRLFMPISYTMLDRRFQKKDENLFWKIVHAVAKISLLKPIRNSLGLSRSRICYTTGAILSPEASRFYHALNLPLKNLYATTEGGPLAGARSNGILLDTVGPPHEGTEIKIGDKGELIYREPGTFVGYYKDPDNTAAVLKDGWFYSGDSCFIREDGHIVFVDRMKNLFELASGDTLAPQSIESQISFSPYIKDAWVLAGPQGAYVSAIIVINYDAVSRWAGQKRVAFTTFAELSQTQEVYELVEHYIQKINSTVPDGSKVRKYVNLHKEFDPNEGEVTRNRKLRKTFLEERYHDLIDAIYSNKTDVQIEAQVRHQDGRTETVKTTLIIKSIKGDAL